VSSSNRPALLVVDVQKDFCPGGALAVPDGDRVVAALNRHIADAAARDWPVFASRDWHPPVTRHFQHYGGEWPAHCIQHSEGASFHHELRLPDSAIVVSKGQEPDSHGYSALEGCTAEGETLLAELQARQIDHLYVGGLATDYCVKHSVLDALGAGLKVTVLADAVAGVDVKPGDSSRALAEMRAAGAAVAG
jgi:nicotinamidase/pyrazinamidase